MNHWNSRDANYQQNSKAFGSRPLIFSAENIRKKIPYLKLSIVFFLLFIFIYANIERLMIWPHFLATCCYLGFLEARKIVIKKNKKALETFIPFDIPFLAVFGIIAILTAVVSLMTIRSSPVLLVFSIVIFVISWGFRIPKLGNSGHLFRNVWIPLVLSAFICFW